MALMIWLWAFILWWTPFAAAQQSNPEKKYDLSCEEKTPACNDTPEQIKTYLQVIDNILKIIGQAPSNVAPDTIDQEITSKTLAKRSNTSAFLNELWNTMYNKDWVFDNYTFMEWASSTIKRDADKILEMYYKILDVNTLVEKQLLKKNVPKNIYSQIDAELKKLKFISLWSTAWDYNLLRSDKEYTTLIKVLAQINQTYAKMFESTFYTEIYEELGTETFRSYVFPSDKSEEKIDTEKLNVVFECLTEIAYAQFVWPFEDLKKDWWESSEYVRIDFTQFGLLIRELEHAYRCTHGRQNVCTDGTKEVRENYTDLNKEVLQKNSNKSRDVITTATSRLKWTLFGANKEDKDAAKQRKQALLESRYGAAGAPSTRGPVKSLTALWAELLEGGKKSLDPAVNLISEFTSSSNRLNCLENYSARSNQETSSSTQWDLAVTHDETDRYDTTSKKKNVLGQIESKREKRIRDGGKVLASENQLQQNQLRILENKIARIEWVFTDYTQKKQKERTEDLVYLDSKIMTKQAVWLSIYVHAAANRLGDYDKDPNSTIVSVNDSLSKMCEAQCTNLSSKKCREDM